MSGPRNDAGFSLTETLVAVAILAAVSVALAPAIRSAFVAHKALGEASEAASAHLHLEHALRDLLAAALQLPDSGDAPTFEGNPGSIRFAARPPGSRSPLVVGIEVAGREDAQSVRITLTPLDGGPSAGDTIGGAYSELRFLFYWEAEEGEPARWRRNWDASRPPRLVVLDMARRPGDDALRRIEVAVGGRAELACDYDSGLQACRQGI
jgi:prepilin-type N-terminal cleavage/methylation domain-containing protein